MFCDFLKWFLREATEATLLMAIIVTPASAYQPTSDERLLCDAKGTVVEYAYTQRNVESKKHLFKLLDVTWEDRWTYLHHATYVDMRRIIEDAYRFQGGKYRREACKAGDNVQNSEDCKALIGERMVNECREALYQEY